jgi:hypothetical protein
MSPYTLGLLAIALFIAGVWQHYSMFPYEYMLPTLSEVLKDYSGFIMLSAVILGIIVVLMLIFGGSPPSIASVIPASIIPASITSYNNSKNILGGITNSLKRNNLASTSFKTV